MSTEKPREYCPGRLPEAPVWPQKYARVFVSSILTSRSLRVALQEDLQNGIIQVILSTTGSPAGASVKSRQRFALRARCCDDNHKSKIDLEHSSQRLPSACLCSSHTRIKSTAVHQRFFSPRFCGADCSTKHQALVTRSPSLEAGQSPPQAS